MKLRSLISVGVINATLALAGSTLISKSGDSQPVPGWSIQSEASVGNLDAVSLAQAGLDVSKWLRVGARSTVMAGLLENNVYNEYLLFYSNNLEKTDQKQANGSWYYRDEFALAPQHGQHFFVETHGITSRADIWLNGHEIASSDVQVGSYGGQLYDVTAQVNNGDNALLIKAYGTDYLRDFAMGFVDWNPYPADNGTGVWRDVYLKVSGPVTISAPRVIHDFDGTHAEDVTVTVKYDVKNYENTTVTGTISGEITQGSLTLPFTQQFKLQPYQSSTQSINVQVCNAKIWWPALWGEQPLYTVNAKVKVNNQVSDIAEQRNFGIRHITSSVNLYNGTEFKVNGNRFLVMGGGYSPDLFVRWDEDRVRNIFQIVIDMGLNSIRLEGKQEQPELYALADEMGLMILAGWECCDKWEGWTYNDDADGVKWTDVDYTYANYSVLHEAKMLQTHASVLAFLIGSDYWPDERATKVYLDAFHAYDWPNPIIASAGMLGYPEELGISGMKMDGPYDWVPTNYWYNQQVGAAFGFGSEEGPGVGTPELGSLQKFLSPSDLNDLWRNPNKDLFHMSTAVSQFPNRQIYNEGLWKSYGAPKSLSDYLIKSQMLDYESVRAEFESFSAYQDNENPATGVIYWMLNGAWPNLHWQLFDYYLKPIGTTFATKVATRPEHVAYDYENKTVYIINHTLDKSGPRTVELDLIDLTGKSLNKKTFKTSTKPNSSKKLGVAPGIDDIKNVAFMRLQLKDTHGDVLSRNVYWLTKDLDTLDWDNSTWYNTPVTGFVDYTAISTLKQAPVSVHVNEATKTLTLENTSDTPAFFIRLNALSGQDEIAPIFWSDNYVTLWPHEKMDITVKFSGVKAGEARVQVSGYNVPEINAYV